MDRRQFFTVIVVAMIFGFLGGAIMHMSMRGYFRKWTRDVYEAQAFRVVDRQGRVRAELSIEEAGSHVFAALRFTDASGRPRIILGNMGQNLTFMDSNYMRTIEICDGSGQSIWTAP